jgi:hypothetical protein
MLRVKSRGQLPKCTLYNKHHGNPPPWATYIGRGSEWGNPFVIGKDGNRAQVIAAHQRWATLQPQLLERIRRELRGKDLVCFCAPLACHGDTLMRIANAPDE